MMESEDDYKRHAEQVGQSLQDFLGKLFKEDGPMNAPKFPAEDYNTGEEQWTCPNCYTEQDGMKAYKKENIRRKCRRCKIWFKEGNKGLERV